MKPKMFNYQADALVLHKNYIRNAKYRFIYPHCKKPFVSLKLQQCDGIQIQFGKNKPKTLLRKENLLFTTAYSLKCAIDVDNKIQNKQSCFDWPRTSEGRDYLEDIFLDRINYFFDNLLFLSDKRNDEHQLLSSVRPIGKEDIISIDFALDNKKVASQGNPLLRLIVLQFEDDSFWPKTSHITRCFGKLPAESTLLFRACSLINYGFYQEAILVSFSVLDAKVQELIEDRMFKERKIDKKETKRFLLSISKERLSYMINIILKFLDKVSLKNDSPELFSSLDKINTKRNKIIHNGERASREEAKKALLTVAKVLKFLNEKHKANFDIPNQLALQRMGQKLH